MNILRVLWRWFEASFWLLTRWKVPDQKLATILISFTYGVANGISYAGIGESLLGIIVKKTIRYLILPEDQYQYLQTQLRQSGMTLEEFLGPSVLIHRLSEKQDTISLLKQARSIWESWGIRAEEITLHTHWIHMARAAIVFWWQNGCFPEGMLNVWQPHDPGYPLVTNLLQHLKRWEEGERYFHKRVRHLGFVVEGLFRLATIILLGRDGVASLWCRK